MDSSSVSCHLVSKVRTDFRYDAMDKERLSLSKGVSPSFSIGLFCSEEIANLFVPDAEERSNRVIIASGLELTISVILCSIAASNSQPPSTHHRKLLPRRPDPKWIHHSRNPRRALFHLQRHGLLLRLMPSRLQSQNRLQIRRNPLPDRVSGEKDHIFREGMMSSRNVLMK
ncbi:hypothetical protein F2Q68_00039421 [Brassica cretica]|uniref:Uncharacterized protein n=1 Tax=Brassica cretica TaxID=69181 RepID=A0A8S9MPL1_BRACR|nr:hypothetical protein F2Q68_00039421 [Brassica cretica]